MKSLLYSDAMMRALLRAESPKCMTRRTQGLETVNAFPDDWNLTVSRKDGGFVFWNQREPVTLGSKLIYPKLRVGDAYYAREAWGRALYVPTPGEVIFRATSPEHAARPTNSLRGGCWRSPLHLRAADARWFGRVTEVRAERLQDISGEDAECEGVEAMLIRVGNPFLPDDGLRRKYWEDYELPGVAVCKDPRTSFKTLWASIHGPESWDASPFVWVYRFERIEKSAALAATNT